MTSSFLSLTLLSQATLWHHPQPLTPPHTHTPHIACARARVHAYTHTHTYTLTFGVLLCPGRRLGLGFLPVWHSVTFITFHKVAPHPKGFVNGYRWSGKYTISVLKTIKEKKKIGMDRILKKITASWGWLEGTVIKYTYGWFEQWLIHLA